jgi:uroporphyrinogen-III synthase
MRLIVTRPERDAQRWVHDLQAAGLNAVAMPLITIGPVPDATHLREAWMDLKRYVGVMFVSGNAVDYFFASKPTQAPEFNALTGPATRAWAPGPGTASALCRAGVAPERMDVPALDAGQFDSETLWRLVKKQVRPGGSVLIVRGGAGGVQGQAGPGVGRDWFAQQVTRAGGHVDFVVAYQRHVPPFNPPERALAREAAADDSLWLFSSTEAVLNLRQGLPEQTWGQARALATHPRIAAAARAAGFGVVCESRPTLADVLSSIESVK